MMKKEWARFIALLLVVLTLGSVMSVIVALAAEDAQSEAAVSISASAIEIPLFERATVTADVIGVSGTQSIRWKSSNPVVATVTQKGVVTFGREHHGHRHGQGGWPDPDGLD